MNRKIHDADAILSRPPFAAWAVRSLTLFVRVRTLPLARWAFARVTPPFVVRRSFLGYQLLVDASRTDTHRLLFVEGPRFVAERRLIASLVTPGCSIVDVGANIGYFMLLCQAYSGGTATVLCLEPEPTNLEELTRTIAYNGLTGVKAQQVAASDVDSVLSLRGGLNGVVGQGGELEVQAHRLDTLVAGRVDLVKIDVEGHEVHVLRGAEQLMATQRPTLIVEVHPELLHAPYRASDVLAILRRHYAHITAHLARARGRLRARLGARYLPGSAIDPPTEPEPVIERAEGGLQREPFWLVAHR